MHVCNLCGNDQSYLGFNKVECPNFECKNYSEKQFEEIYKKPAPKKFTEQDVEGGSGDFKIAISNVNTERLQTKEPNLSNTPKCELIVDNDVAPGLILDRSCANDHSLTFTLSEDVVIKAGQPVTFNFKTGKITKVENPSYSSVPVGLVKDYAKKDIEVSKKLLENTTTYSDGPKISEDSFTVDKLQEYFEQIKVKRPKMDPCYLDFDQIHKLEFLDWSWYKQLIYCQNYYLKNDELKGLDGDKYQSARQAKILRDEVWRRWYGCSYEESQKRANTVIPEFVMGMDFAETERKILEAEL